MGKNRQKSRGKQRSNKNSAKSSPKSDAVTGLSIIDDLFGRLESDKVYSKDSPLSYSGYGTNEDWQLEIEFGDPKYFVKTEINGSGRDKRISRQVLEGEFQYKDDRIVSAKIYRVASFGASPGENREYGEVFAYAGGNQMAKPSSIASWSEALLFSDFNRSTYFSYHTEPTGEIAIDGDKAATIAFGGGKFFYEGWENDPFTPNLI